MAGKAYSKAMGDHKFTLQALGHLLMPNFLSYISDYDEEYHCSIMEATNDLEQLMVLLKIAKFVKVLLDVVVQKSNERKKLCFLMKLHGDDYYVTDVHTCSA